jgi:hypothetical protein
VKRSDALAPLSRDHHHALDAALRLRRADEAGVDDAVAHFGSFWRDHGLAHFEIEERLILPALPANDPDWAAGIERVRREHAAVRQQAAELLAGRPEVERARALGELLNGHVRFEERHLFALLEARLGAGELTALGAAVAAAELSAHSPE